MIKRHTTKWAVKTSLTNNYVKYFTSKEDAVAFAFEHGYAIFPPIFADD